MIQIPLFDDFFLYHNWEFYDTWNGPDRSGPGPDPFGTGMGPDGSGMGPDGSGWVRMGPEWIPSYVYRFWPSLAPAQRAAGDWSPLKVTPGKEPAAGETKFLRTEPRSGIDSYGSGMGPDRSVWVRMGPYGSGMGSVMWSYLFRIVMYVTVMIQMIYDRIESECEFTSINWNNSQYLSRFVFNLVPAERAAGYWTPLKENLIDKFLSGPVLNGSGPAPNSPDRSGCPDGFGWVRMGSDGSGWVRMGPVM